MFVFLDTCLLIKFHCCQSEQLMKCNFILKLATDYVKHCGSDTTYICVCGTDFPNVLHAK